LLGFGSGLDELCSAFVGYLLLFYLYAAAVPGLDVKTSSPAQSLGTLCATKMNSLILSTFFTCYLLASLGCKDNKHAQKTINQNKQTGQLIPVDFNDSNYNDLNFYAIDTVTKDGWAIKYFVKDDSTKYDDIYIEWAKGSSRGIFKAEYYLKFRRYFIPQFTGENDKYLFFWHGCATDCQAVLILGKDSTFSRDYTQVIDYNIPYGQIAYVGKKGTADGKPFQISLVDLAKNKEHLIQFKNLCMYAAHKESCIDTIIFNKEKVVVKATLTIDNYNRDKEVAEEIKVNLN
jgi:hypothetical protein